MSLTYLASGDDGDRSEKDVQESDHSESREEKTRVEFEHFVVRRNISTKFGSVGVVGAPVSRLGG